MGWEGVCGKENRELGKGEEGRQCRRDGKNVMKGQWKGWEEKRQGIREEERKVEA